MLRDLESGCIYLLALSCTGVDTFGQEIGAVFVQSCAHLCGVVLVSTGWNVAVRVDYDEMTVLSIIIAGKCL